MLTEKCNAILQNKLPQKLGDLGSFTIPCTLGGIYFEKALCDSGASINLIPLSIFRKLDLGEMKDIGVSLQFADQSTKKPKGIIENVLVRVDKFVFPVDFIVLEMKECPDEPIILGRPFLVTGRAIIDVHQGQLIVRVDEERIIFDMQKMLRFSRDESSSSCFSIDMISHLTDEYRDDQLTPDSMERYLTKSGTIQDDDPIIRREAEILEKDSEDQEMQPEEIPIAPEDQDKTTFTCPHGTYAYRRMPFGLCNATATFQRCMSTIFSDMTEKFLEIFMDDFTLFGKTFKDSLKYLLAKKDARTRLLRWILLLQKFDLEIKDKKGTENQVANHLSRLENPPLEFSEIKEEFHDEHIFSIDSVVTQPPWFADIANYLVGKWTSKDLSYQQRKKLISDAKYYLWNEPYLFKFCADNIIRRYVPEEEMTKILYHCHDGAVGGHYVANRTAFKVLEAGFFWPTLFKDARTYVAQCDRCQRTCNIPKRDEMSLQSIHVNELEEMRLEAYENARIFKEKTKIWHDKLIRQKSFKIGDKVLLYNSRLRLFPEKLKSRWTGPYNVTNITSYGATEIQQISGGDKFKVIVQPEHFMKASTKTESPMQDLFKLFKSVLSSFKYRLSLWFGFVLFVSPGIELPGSLIPYYWEFASFCHFSIGSSCLLHWDFVLFVPAVTAAIWYCFYCSTDSLLLLLYPTS
uniref:Uncharacterized protein LOC104248338 n=1 Tax=Nicotiana sylvestris TaxID=4096 RepID=A0A1U7YUK2_NICSY